MVYSILSALGIILIALTWFTNWMFSFNLQMICNIATEPCFILLCVQPMEIFLLIWNQVFNLFNMLQIVTFVLVTVKK